MIVGTTRVKLGDEAQAVGSKSGYSAKAIRACTSAMRETALQFHTPLLRIAGWVS